uniref:Uncharacterized protein n=1 Tax=Triticum urartu TaxID=4572 RepID=A0A8R7Q8J8_TRIUA
MYFYLTQLILRIVLLKFAKFRILTQSAYSCSFFVSF